MQEPKLVFPSRYQVLPDIFLSIIDVHSSGSSSFKELYSVFAVWLKFRIQLCQNPVIPKNPQDFPVLLDFY